MERSLATTWFSVMVAYASGTLSEGVASKLLELDRVSLRDELQRAETLAAETHAKFKAGEFTMTAAINESAARHAAHRCHCD
jgi:hypothetical protein